MLIFFLVVLAVHTTLVCGRNPLICGPEYYQLENNFTTPENIAVLKETFFPENNVPPLQIIVTYKIVDRSGKLEHTVWAWMWNPVYVFCGSRFLAEFGLGIPVISLKHKMKNFSQPFIKVKDIQLTLHNLTVSTSHTPCIRKLTSLLKEFAKHGNDTKSVQVANSVFSVPYSSSLELANISFKGEGQEVWTLHVAVTVYAVLLSFFILPLLYYLVKEYYRDVVSLVRESDSVWYGIFWGVFTFCCFSNIYHTISYLIIWRRNISWAYVLFDNYTIVYHCVWWIVATMFQVLAAVVFPKQDNFPFPRIFSIVCFLVRKDRMGHIVQSVVMFVFLYFVHIQAQSAMFMALAIVADPVTSTTWIISTFLLRIALTAFISSLFSIDRYCSIHHDIRLTFIQAVKDSFHLFSWGIPFLGACLLIGGFSGLTFMDKDTQPKYVSSIASFLLAPPILAFLGWLSRFFIRKLFFMVSSGHTQLVNANGYSPLTNDDVDIDDE